MRRSKILMTIKMVGFGRQKQMPIGVQPLKQFNHRRVNREDGFKDGLDRDLSNIKMKIMAFQGKNDPEAYLEWGKNGVNFFFLSQLL